MELFGLALAFPGAFFLTVIYRFMLVTADPHYPWIRRWFTPISYVALALLAVELLALVTVGAKQTQALVGPLFEILRGLVFFMATPALVTLIVFRAPGKWYVIGPIGAAFAFALVLLQFHVSDQLYGEKVERPYRSMNRGYRNWPKRFSSIPSCARIRLNSGRPISVLPCRGIVTARPSSCSQRS